MFKIPLFGKQKLLLAFEYGTVLARVMKDFKDEELSPEVVKRCEDIILKEFTEKSADRVALDMVPNLLASIETK